MRISILAACALLAATAGEAVAQSTPPTPRPGSSAVGPVSPPVVRTTVATDGSTVTQVGQTLLRYGPAAPAGGTAGLGASFVRSADGRLHACQTIGQTLICN